MLEKTLESPLDCKEIKPVYPKANQSWIFIGRIDAQELHSDTLATWFEELTHQKRPWYWERLKAGVKGDDRGWDGWMALLMTQWTWIWASSGSWWWTGKPGMLKSTGSQRVRCNWVTEQQQQRGGAKYSSVLWSFWLELYQQVKVQGDPPNFGDHLVSFYSIQGWFLFIVWLGTNLNGAGILGFVVILYIE